MSTDDLKNILNIGYESKSRLSKLTNEIPQREAVVGVCSSGNRFMKALGSS